MKTVAIQGIRGSYSEEAAGKLCGPDAEIVPCGTFAHAFAALAEGTTQFAVMPVENKIVGEISEPVRLLRESGKQVLGQLRLEIRHVLAGTPDAEFESLASVRTHPEALKQCSVFLKENPQIRAMAGPDTASSVQDVVGMGNRRHGAIASERAAKLYGAKIIRENIADDNDNWTTFYLIGN